jgi:Flp pilus assembly protein TadD
MNHAFTAFRTGDCARAIDRSLAASSAFPVRPEPFELIGYCDIRFGRNDLAIRAFEEAIERDPNNWRYHYGLALTQAIAGLDPRPEADRAHQLNTQSPLAIAAVEAFKKPERTWERSARALPLPGR